jgi:signal transduction histidine kinase
MHFTSAPAGARQSNRTSEVVAVISTVGGLIVLAGWFFDVPVLKSAIPTLAPMKLNAAIAFILCGASLWCAQQGDWRSAYRLVSLISASLALLLGLASFGEYLSGVDLGVDQFVMHERTTFAGDIPGRMAIAAAVSFMAIGLSLLLLNLRPDRSGLTIHLLAIVPILTAGSALIGYAYDVEEFIRMKLDYSPIALNAAALLVLLTFGILYARPNYPLRRLTVSDGAARVTVRLLLPAAVGFTFIAGWLMHFAGLHVHYFSGTRQLALFAAISISGLTALMLWAAERFYQADGARKRAHAEVLRLNTELEERVKARTEELASFSYSVSHDLKAPLRAIDGACFILQTEEGSRISEEGRRRLEVVRRSVVRMTKQIDGLIEFVGLYGREMRIEPVDMRDLASEVFEELRAAEPERAIALRLGDLPAAHGDHGMIRQALKNLLDNAIKFTSMQTRPEIEVGGAPGETENVYWIKDNGVGFDARFAHRLFGVSMRLHPLDEFEGPGVGLAIVKRIIERHGGSVSAQGEVGNGATFRFTLPSAGEGFEEHA